MDREERLAHLRLIRTPNIGPMTFSLLLQRYGSATAALRAVPELAKRGGDAETGIPCCCRSGTGSE